MNSRLRQVKTHRGGLCWSLESVFNRLPSDVAGDFNPRRGAESSKVSPHWAAQRQRRAETNGLHQTHRLCRRTGYTAAEFTPARPLKIPQNQHSLRHRPSTKCPGYVKNTPPQGGFSSALCRSRPKPRSRGDSSTEPGDLIARWTLVKKTAEKFHRKDSRLE